MIDREHELSVALLAVMLDISRSSLYYLPRSVSPGDLALMRRIDELHLDYPFAGARMLRDLLGREGFAVGRLHVSTLMKRMGIEAIYRRPNTSKPATGHKVYPYLLRRLTVTRPNQVWSIDITYIPMARGFVYLAAVVDWFSRRVLAWRLSISMDVSFCIEAVEEALGKYGAPEIFNSNQGSQFTSMAFTSLLRDNGIAISVDGRGAWRDNVFVERLWRSIKYEEVYLSEYETPRDARRGVASAGVATIAWLLMMPSSGSGRERRPWRAAPSGACGCRWLWRSRISPSDLRAQPAGAWPPREPPENRGGGTRHR